jgi:YidC/Oxa1 family membrane protein insertase
VTEPKKEMSHEYRTLLAVILCLAVLIGFSYFNKPKPQPPADQSQTASTSTSPNSQLPSQQTPTTQAPAVQSTAPQNPSHDVIGSQITGIASAPSIVVPAHAATAERTVVIESGVYHVEISNKGAVVRKWVLEQYTDESTPPKKLDLVHPEAAAQFGGWPLALVLDDPNLESRANAGLYEVKVTPDTPGTIQTPAQAPAEVDLTWSDGHLSVVKKIKFDNTYIADVHVSVELDGRPVSAAIAWRGGFGDAGAFRGRGSQATQAFFSLGGKLDLLAANKLGIPNNPTQKNIQSGPLDFAGMEDQFFAMAFLPPLQTVNSTSDQPAAVSQLAGAGQPDVVGTSMTLVDWAVSRQVVDGSSTSTELIPEVAAGSSKGGPLNVRLFVGPKNLDELKQIRPPLNELVQFGWLAIIAEPLFYLLRWTHNYIPNYGWAIVALTIALNMVLLPMRIKSTRSMQKMQRVGPEVKAIQDRYKKYSMKDPRKAKMNEEVMAVYSREGINPLGSCLPTLLQMPIWFALYRMLNVTIELRHAPWFGWLQDLSSKDPYYILPILMSVSMYAMQKMTPTPGGDPAQQKMMALMPIMFGGMFIIFPVSSGLVLYIFTSNLVNMGQQYFLNKSNPLPMPALKGAKK